MKAGVRVDCVVSREGVVALLMLPKAAVRAAERGSFVPRLSGQTSLAPLGIWLRLFPTGRGGSRRLPLKDVSTSAREL